MAIGSAICTSPRAPRLLFLAALLLMDSFKLLTVRLVLVALSAGGARGTCLPRPP